MKERETLTKSLHTVTVISRVAKSIADSSVTSISPTDACRAALRMLGMDDSWTRNDPTFAACVSKAKELIGNAEK